MGAMAQGKRIGYVLRKFPVLSETFILNEMLALEARKARLHVFSLDRPNDPRFHEDLPRLKARVAYIPDVFESRRLLEHGSRLRRSCRKGYFKALRYVIRKGSPTLFWRFLQACYVANEARRLGLDHLHAHFATRPASVAFLASKISGIPYSFTAHAMDIFKSHLDPRALVRKIEGARFVVTVSDFNKAYLEERTPLAKGKVFRIYNGIPLARFASNGVFPEAPFTFLCVARLVEKKGIPILIEACRILRDGGALFRCWIVGKGRIRPQLEELIARWRLADHVRLLGPLTQLEVLKRYRSAHLYVLPCIIGSDGNRDGLPVSIVEALACGLPVLTTPVTGIPEVVRDRVNGLLVRPGDAESLARAILELMSDRALYDSLKANARSSIESSFDLARTAEALHGLFEEAPT
jgi:colanic acid/amylovoran biosynthesis glycosyltransferase